MIWHHGARNMPTEGRWLLLAHQIPAKPDYLRVKVARRLAKIGAVALKKSVYALPRTDGAREDFDWLRGEITAAGGEALVIEASLAAGLSDGDVEDLFRRARDADYVELTESVRTLARSVGKRRIAEERRRALLVDVARLERRLDEIVAIDFFGGASREPARALLADLRRRVEARAEPIATRTDAADRPRGRTWVTRAGVHVDRIASAWLIRRFIDPDATFKLVSPRGYVPEPGELRFDMEAAEHTHEGERCTFEVLCARFGLEARGLRAIAEIVHDIDLKDGKYGRAETAGFASLIAGIALVHRDDEARLCLGFEVLDAMIAALARRSDARPKGSEP